MAFTQEIIKHIAKNIRASVVVRVRKSVPCYTGQSQVIPLPMLAEQTYRYVTQALQTSGLRIKQNDKLLPVVKSLGVFVSRISINTFLENVTRKQL